MTRQGVLHNRMLPLYFGRCFTTLHKLYFAVIAIWVEGGSVDEGAYYSIIATDHFYSLKKQESSNIDACVSLAAYSLL